MDTYEIIHIILAIIALIFFCFIYFKEKKIYQLLIVIWIPTTLLNYVSNNNIFLILLGVLQFILFGLVLFFLFKPNKNKTKQSNNEKIGNINSVESDQVN